MADLKALQAAVESGDRKSAIALTGQAVEARQDPTAILGAMTAAMAEVGRRYECDEIYVPEMLISAAAMKEAMVILEPVLVAAGVRPQYTAVIGTIQGDLHDIGKNLVALMWKGADIDIVDLGTDVSPGDFVAAAQEHGAHLIGVSALLTTTMTAMKDVIRAVRDADLPHVKVIVGGAPVTAEYAHEIGADGYAPDAAAAVIVARRALGAA
jgi:5-methyltetrahydrofolate--homocysteine methyltransferase